ncbi:hypothetical protein [Oscillatoria salina]|uniref:hypothetical protein n=1 Tax=Oscillatoria salina TaxID=331517 RepID=UPI0013BC23C1|nr:hypothetical protein [Oscillatoria salina]MBZ8181421.1 hypothetical protein [Oscillatoria salina IIICB1]NET88727.1 hypothetical protein [Kamptonema sp. SIO1D9]
MTVREQLLKEIAQSSDAFVEEVLNFVLFTKSRRSETSPDSEADSQQLEDKLTLEELQQQTQDALKEAGYDTREKIVHLVQEVKREMIIERQNHSNLVADETSKQLTD